MFEMQMCNCRLRLLLQRDLCVCVCVCVCVGLWATGESVSVGCSLKIYMKFTGVARRASTTFDFSFPLQHRTSHNVSRPLSAAEPFLFLVGAGGGLNPEALVCSQHRRGEEEGGCGRGAGEVLESIHYISIDPPLFFTALSL